jgi:hypothetical protein
MTSCDADVVHFLIGKNKILFKREIKGRIMVFSPIEKIYG